MEPVAAGDDVAVELAAPPLVLESDARLVAVEVVDCDVVDLEEQRQPGSSRAAIRSFDDLVLAVDR